VKDEWDDIKFASQPVRKYAPDRNRILSGTVAVGWLALCAIAGLEAFLTNILAIALPLACIWFPEELGSMTTSFLGPFSNVAITRSSPGFLVRLVGWIALLALTVLRVIIVVAMRP